MKKIIIFSIIAVTVCAGLLFFRDRTPLRTASGWDIYTINSEELLDDNGLSKGIYSSFGLNRMKKLKTLDVRLLDSFDFLEELNELEELSVNIDKNHTLDISEFPEVQSLKKLTIINSDYTEIFTDEISDRMPELECIWFFGGHITDDNISDIGKCRNIKSILFWGIDRKPFDLTPLTKLDNLEELNLQRIFPQIDLTPLSDMSELKVLQCTVYNEEEIKSTSHLSSLQSMEISFYPQVKDDKLELPENYFNGLKSMEEFTAYDFKISDDLDVSSLPSGLKKMTFIDCNISENIKDKISESGIDIEVKQNSNY